jgi:hypothetical protein
MLRVDPAGRFDQGGPLWDNRSVMKKVAVLALVALFAASMFHFYYAEDHCPVHCPSRGGQIGHVHPHHPGGSVCLCFWTSLMGPEASAAPPLAALLTFIAPSAEVHVLGRTAADITPPPRSFSV